MKPLTLNAAQGFFSDTPTWTIPISMTEHKMLQCLACPNFDWRKQWLLKPMVDLNDSSLADGSVLGHDSVAGEYQRQKLSGGGAVLLFL